MKRFIRLVVCKEIEFMNSQGDVIDKAMSVERLVDLSIYEGALATLPPRK